MGERLALLEEAIRRISNDDGIQLNKVSGLYETEPIGYLDQQHFYNLVIQISTALTPDELLEITQRIESDMGRVRTIINGPRTIDIDILFFGDKIVETKLLTIPHPRLWERDFVLIPLRDLVSRNTILPGTTLPLSEWLKQGKGKDGVIPCQHIIWDNEYERFVNLKDLRNRS